MRDNNEGMTWRRSLVSQLDYAIAAAPQKAYAVAVTTP
jgi:hypothetical protein